jgi:hypothetical protein
MRVQRQRKACNNPVGFCSSAILSKDIHEKEIKRWTARYRYHPLKDAAGSWPVGEFASASANTENDHSYEPTTENLMTDAEHDVMDYGIVTVGATPASPYRSIRTSASACLIDPAPSAPILSDAFIEPCPFVALRRSFCAADLPANYCTGRS